MYHGHGLFVDEAWRGASDGGAVPVLSPVSEKALDATPVATAADIVAALDSAARGFKLARIVH